MNQSNRTPPRLPVGAWELEDFFRDLRACVHQLEQAFEQGQLERELQRNEGRLDWHVPIVAAYRRLLRRPSLPPTGYRHRAVHALLDQARRELFDTPHLFEARVTAAPRRKRQAEPGALESRDHGRIEAIAVKSPRGEVLVRMDQVIAVRFWGIGYTFDDPEVGDRITTAVAHETVNQLAYALVGLEKVQRRLHGRVLSEDLQVIPPPDGRRFEQLLADVLNEHYPCARHAPLYEDFFEKTDLRLHVRGLQRRRGARAQITRIAGRDRHATKLAQIHNLDEFVVLSPPSLAAAVLQPESCGLSPEDVRLFWQLFPTPPTSDDELAGAIRDLLVQAIARPTAGPRGPLAAVPEALRILIQSYAAAEAFRATERLRVRLAREGLAVDEDS
jgi:hypothetical protein